MEEALDEGFFHANEAEDRLRTKADQAAHRFQNRVAIREGARQLRLNQLQRNLSKQREAANRSAEDWKEWHDKTIGQFDKLLAQRESEYRTLQREAASLEQSILLARREYASIQAQLSTFDPRNRPGARGDALTQLPLVEQQLVRYEGELLAVQVKQLKTMQEGAACMSQRRQAILQFERATGAISESKSKVDAWAERLATRQKSMQATRRAPAKKRPVNFAQLIPFDLEAARRQLVADLQAP